MGSNSQFGRDPSQYNGRAAAAGMVAAGAIASAVGVGIVNAINARSLADGRAIAIGEWAATVDYLEAHCQIFDRKLTAAERTIKTQELEILQLRAELEIARFRATTKH